MNTGYLLNLILPIVVFAFCILFLSGRKKQNPDLKLAGISIKHLIIFCYVGIGIELLLLIQYFVNSSKA